MNKPTDTYKLYNGVEIPCIGFGTWQTPSGDVAVSSVRCPNPSHHPASQIT